ncbi:MAG: hypothetical protein GY703_25855 [Gammaproteobacteria bacterium]|nr:hypothetical protein [Gammaproteobacteria bacterium]
MVITAVWLVYFGLHSLLASLMAKRWVSRHYPGLLPGYRLFFNLVAVLLLIPPLYLTYGYQGPWLRQWSGAGWWLANGLAMLALCLFFWSLNFYDSGEFIGTRQWRQQERKIEDQEAFHISPLHRFVRHPWYALGLVLVWTRDMNLAMFWTSLVITLYFLLGSRLEENKLLEYHGAAYRNYRTRVPGIIPRPWRRLNRREAQELENDARRT